MKLFQVNEDDLSQLESDLPILSESLAPHLNRSDRIILHRVREILSRVRWNYGPPEDIEVINEDDLDDLP